MNASRQMIDYKGIPLSYTLVTKKVKNINMHINENGEIVVSASPFVPVEKIDEFVSGKITWILAQRQKMMSRKETMLISSNQIVLFGKTLKIKQVYGGHNYIHYDQDTLFIQLKKGADQEKVLQNFIDKTCRDIFEDIAQIMHKKLQDYSIDYPAIKIRTMKTRWGSCMPSKHTITLNKKLIHYPIEFIEYVILHEFVHFIQPNHSKAFYHIIEYHMPDYKKRIQMAG